MDPSPGTTNLLLAIMAAVSVLEALVLLAVGVGGFLAYTRLMSLINDLEARHVAPAMHRVNYILDEVKDITRTLHQETERADSAIRSSVNRVNETADTVRSKVRTATRRVVGVVEGARAAVESILERGDSGGGEPL